MVKLDTDPMPTCLQDPAWSPPSGAHLEGSLEAKAAFLVLVACTLPAWAASPAVGLLGPCALLGKI